MYLEYYLSEMHRHTITLIGAGNLAWHLGPALENVGCKVREVYSRQLSHASKLTSRLYEASETDSLDFSHSASEIFIIAVADDAIHEVVDKLIVPEDALVVHTSGSKPLEILQNDYTAKIGVFYPLQSFRKERDVDFERIPIFVESQEEGEPILYSMARALSKSAHKITGEKRFALHLAAVFASNFVNHMISISQQIAEQEKLDFSWLAPLIGETVDKAMALGPRRAQTGPARRGDLQILDAHMEYLQKDEGLSRIYQAISQHILDEY